MKIRIVIKDIEDVMELHNQMASQFLETFTSERKEWITVKEGDSLFIIRRENIIAIYTVTSL